MMTAGEAVALRRIALLVTRATEDCDPIRADLSKIATVIDAMKRSLVLGAPLDKDVDKLSTLVRKLPAENDCETSSCRRLRTSLMHELQELVQH